MKILVAHNFYQQPGGEDAVYHAECAMLVAAGHEVVRYEVRNDDLKGGFAALSAGLNAVHSPSRFDELTALFREHRPDVVHVHNFFPLITPAIFVAAKACGIPSVMTLHNFRLTCAGAQLYRDGAPCELCVGGSAYQGALHRCYRGSLPSSLAAARMIEHHRKRGTWNTDVTCFIALTDFAKTKFIEAGLPPAKLKVKPNFAPFAEMPMRAPLSTQTPFLFVGRLSPEKGLSQLLQIWRDIDAPLRIIGDGPERAALEGRAPANVTFEGALPAANVARAMAEARALVVPSRWYEGFPMVLVEAMAAGLPIIGARLGSLSSLIEPGKNGELVDLDDTAAWQAAIATLATNNSIAEVLSRGARQMYEEQYTDIQNIRLLEEIYNEAIALGANPANSTVGL